VTKRGYLIAIILLTILTVISLALNGVIVLGLLRAQQVALTTLAEAQTIVSGIGDDTFSYTFEVKQEIPIDTSIPFNEEITVPIEMTIPINTTVVVPIDLGLTSYDLKVPIRTVFPVDMEFTVPVSKTVNIATTVPLDLEVPIEIPLADTPLIGYLEELEEALAQTEVRIEQLGQPLGSQD